ncbi:hypothetical protein TYRP_021898 [Tyrophagus putrescentiae]|nr:hypothetical protein TYRP_021898 [Tyrophagus putrescentiae]
MCAHVDAAAAPSACTTAHPTYRIGVEANEAVVVAALFVPPPVHCHDGRRVEKAQRGNAMDDVASVATVVLLIVVRTGELVWTGGIAQQGEPKFAGKLKLRSRRANATGKVECNRRGNMPGVLAPHEPSQFILWHLSSMRSLTVPVFIRSLSPAFKTTMLSPSSVVGSRSEKRRLIVTAVPQRKKPSDKRLNGRQKAEERKAVD